VKRYVNEVGTAWVLGVTDPRTGNRILVARVTGVEVVAALTRAGRNRGPAAVAATAAQIRQFRQDFANEYRVVEVTASVLSRAMMLAQIHGLRGYDAVQLAAALEVHSLRPSALLPPLTLVSADVELNAAARAEGLMVDDPNSHP
jgi:uncharacterized protein